MKDSEFLSYMGARFKADFTNGFLIWNPLPESYFKTRPACRTWNTRFAGKIAGTTTRDYQVVSVKGKLYLVHRLLYMMYNNVVLKDNDCLDHINTDKLDNRIENIRLVSRSQNGMNRGKQTNNSSGYTGISWCKERSKWEVHIKVSRKKYHLGRFSSLDQAIAARQQAEKKYFGEYGFDN